MKKLVVIKHSEYEWDKLSLNLSHDELIKHYNSHHTKDIDAILRHHDKHAKMIETLKTVLFRADFCMLDDVKATITGYDLVIMMGGDNSFTKITHSIGDTPVLPVNAYPEKSYGYLTKWTINDDHDIYDLIEAIDFYEFDAEEWPRLETTIDGTHIIASTSECFLGERVRNKMSKNIVVYKGKEYHSRSSGIVVATGAGSTGWYSSVASIKTAWSPQHKLASFVVSEPFKVKPLDLVYTNKIKEQEIDLTHGEIIEGEELIIRSLNNDGVVSSDSWEYFPFPHGSEAKIYLGKPLNVIAPHPKSHDETK